LAPCSEVPVSNPVHRFIGKDTSNLPGSCQKKRVGDQDGVCEDITVAVIISELQNSQTVSVNRVKAYKVRPAPAEIHELFRGRIGALSLYFLLMIEFAGALFREIRDSAQIDFAVRVWRKFRRRAWFFVQM
jgi:hypothetical protein